MKKTLLYSNRSCLLLCILITKIEGLHPWGGRHPPVVVDCQSINDAVVSKFWLHIGISIQ